MKKFTEFLLHSILESAADGELPLYFSTGFRDLVKQIGINSQNEIASRLLNSQGDSSKRVFVDIDPDSIDKVTFIMSNKAEEILNRRDNIEYLTFREQEEIYKSRQRSSMKVNRFINALFNNEYDTKKLSEEEKERNRESGKKTPPQQLEEFVNIFKSLRTPGKMELVSGGDIPHWYLSKRNTSGGGSLNTSCMNGSSCQEYLEFYEVNEDKISMLIMKDRENDELICGRALVWKLDDPTDRIYMDRIYTNNDHDVENFKQYAKENGWLYKYKQNMDSEEYIVDTKDNTKERITLIVNDIENSPNTNSSGKGLYPYLDTLKYYSPETDIISNNVDSLPTDLPIYTLEGTSGSDYSDSHGYTLEQMIEMYKDDILDDIIYYAVDLYPSIFWDNLDDDRYIKDYKSDEISYYLDDFQYQFEDEEELKDYINEYGDSDKVPDLDDLDLSELQDLTDVLGIRYDIASDYADKRYNGYTAQEIHEEMYGSAEELTKEIFRQYENYLDEDDFAQEIADREDEDYLRDRYNNN